MEIYIYIITVVLYFAKIGFPMFLLFRLFFIVKPLLINLYAEEKFKYYIGINKSRLIILFSLFLLSCFLGILFGNEISKNPDIYNQTFYAFLLVLIQSILLYLFETKTPVHILKILNQYILNPKEIFKERKVVFEESRAISSIQNGLSFKDVINLSNGDIIKQIGSREFELIIEKHKDVFQDQFSIDNLYKLCNGIKIKEGTIAIKIDNKRNSKQNIVEILASLFNIQQNWNSQIKDRSNTKIVDFLNTYIVINQKKKILHSNDFTRLFEKLD